MSRIIRILVTAAVSSAAFAQDPSPPQPPTESDLSARSKALELAGAFSNDGYKIRDGYWPGKSSRTERNSLR